MLQGCHTGNHQWLDVRYSCRGLRRRTENQNFWEVEREACDANNQRAKIAGDILKELGVEVSPYYANSYGSGMGRYTGDIVIDPADLFRLIGIGFQLPEKKAKPEKPKKERKPRGKKVAS